MERVDSAVTPLSIINPQQQGVGNKYQYYSSWVWTEVLSYREINPDLTFFPNTTKLIWLQAAKTVHTQAWGLKCCEVPVKFLEWVSHTHILVDLEHDWWWVEVNMEVIHQHMELPDLFCHGIRHLNMSRKQGWKLFPVEDFPTTFILVETHTSLVTCWHVQK